MKMVSKTATSTITCQIEVDKNCRIHFCTACKLLPESVAYAVCRFIQAAPSLRHGLVQESYHLRLAKGRERCTQHRSFVVPAVLMDLPGGWVQVSVTVSPEGITISKIHLCEEYPIMKKPHRK